MAFRANTTLTSHQTITRPASAGPAKRARLNTMLLIATAVASAERGTRLGTSARRAGWTRPSTRPPSITRPIKSSTVMSPVAVSANRVSDCSMINDCAMRIRRSRSKRSASAPPNGPITIVGNRSANATRPRIAPEWLSSQASQPTAIRCIQVPISETLLPAM